jgi:hypothetical protein
VDGELNGQDTWAGPEHDADDVEEPVILEPAFRHGVAEEDMLERMNQMRRNLEALIASADALADQLESYEPKPEDFDAPLMAVKLAAFKRDAAERDLARAVEAAREQKVSWRKLGEAIGTSGEAVRQRYSHA